MYKRYSLINIIFSKPKRYVMKRQIHVGLICRQELRIFKEKIYGNEIG